MSGATSLRAQVPTMVRVALEDSRWRIEDIGNKNVSFIPHAAGGELEPEVMAALHRAFRDYGLVLHEPRERCPTDTRRLVTLGNGDLVMPPRNKNACVNFWFGVEYNTPLVAQVTTAHFYGSHRGVHYSHWRLWLFGYWIPISDGAS